MTTELEKTFFDSLGIEPRDNFKGCKNGITFYTYGCNIPSCKGCSKEIREREYPQITDRILLELICILNENTTLDETYYQGASTVKELKKLVLKDLIKTKDNFDTIHQVRTLFKEE